MSQASNHGVQHIYPKRVCQPSRRRTAPVLVSRTKVLANPEQRLPTEERRITEVPLERLLEAAKIVVWEAEVETWRFTYVSDQAQKILGYPIADWYEPEFLALHLHPEDKRQIFWPSQFQVAEHDFTFRMLASDGRVVWFHTLISVASRCRKPKSLSGFMIDISERKRAEKALEDLGGRLIDAQEKERSRIARELHDDLNQRLALLSIGLEQLGKQTVKELGNHHLLQKLKKQTREISSDIHRLSYRLHPSKLDHLGLVAAVRSQCEETSQSANLKVEFHQNGFPPALPKDIALCLFRVAQEALSNSAKHSDAQSVRVLLRKTSDAVRLTVSDDGCGFDPNSEGRQSGLGFISMRERVHILGGEIQINSQPQCGTCIDVSVPLVRDLVSGH